jgi:hypothetical protein
VLAGEQFWGNCRIPDDTVTVLTAVVHDPDLCDMTVDI